MRGTEGVLGSLGPSCLVRVEGLGPVTQRPPLPPPNQQALGQHRRHFPWNTGKVSSVKRSPLPLVACSSFRGPAAPTDRTFFLSWSQRRSLCDPQRSKVHPWSPAEHVYSLFYLRALGCQRTVTKPPKSSCSQGAAAIASRG